MQHEALSKEGEVNEGSENLEWFFESPDVESWDSTSSTEILQLGGKSRLENHQVFHRLQKSLLDRRFHVILVSCSLSHGFDQKAMPNEQILRVIRSLICQLMNNDNSPVHYAMEHYPLSEIKQASIFTSNLENMLKHLLKVLFYSLISMPGRRVYLMLDEIDVLGPEMYRLVEGLSELRTQLLRQDAIEKPVVKIFFNTPPRNFSGLAKDLRRMLDKIPYIEKDKELKGSSALLPIR